ncbi:MAG TPA: hypothetical protein VFZ56_13705 [Gemmatimonadaceae bacterium]
MGTTNRRSTEYARFTPAVKRDMVCRIALASLLVTLAACGGSLVEPFVGGKAPVGGDAAGGQPGPTPAAPPVSPAGAPIFLRVSPSDIPGTQRYVFYDDASFGLQYERPDWGFFEYRGRYGRNGEGVSFSFDANNGAWTATGTFRGDSLIVKYNDMMLWDDFEDGVYVLTSSVVATP